MPCSSREYLKRDDIRGLYPSQLNGESARRLGKAVCELLQKKGTPRPVLVVGHDCRRGNTEISQGLSLGFMEAGGECRQAGLVSTEHIYYLCGEEAAQYTAGAMVTASHNPREYNGIKFIHSGCLPFSPEDLAFLGSRADELCLTEDCSVLEPSRYARHLFSLAGLQDLPEDAERPLKLLVLSGNGMGQVAFESLADLLKPKGIQTIFREGKPNGEFPHGVPNPLLPDFMARLGKQVRLEQADLGIGFDGDADRAGFTDETGAVILPSQVLALIAQDKLERLGDAAPAKRPVIMKNLCCSRLLDELFPADGPVELVETPVGHGRIKQLMRSEAYRSRVLFAGEHSGHYFYPEFHSVDSGVLTTLYMVGLLRRRQLRGISLSRQLSPWRARFSWSGELNYTMKSTDATRQAMVAVAKAMEERGGGCRREVRMDEALRAQRVFSSSLPYDPRTLGAPDLKFHFSHGDGGWWFVLRPSGNEPKLRLNVEAWGGDASLQCQEKVQLLEALLLAAGAQKA
ncbi:MAG: hypothetical protein ACI4SG_04715 [Oligosphaeraceae bacterium]